MFNPSRIARELLDGALFCAGVACIFMSIGLPAINGAIAGIGFMAIRTSLRPWK